MKKTLIASAVAAAALSTTQVAFAEEGAASFDFYGNVQITYANDVTTDNNANTETSENETQDNGSTIGWKGEAEAAAGLTAFAKVEIDKLFVDGDKDNAGDLGRLDEGYLGLKGDFGEVKVGKDETVYDDNIDIIDFSEYAGVAGDLSGMSQKDQIQYNGSFGDLGVGVSYIGDTDADSGVRAALVGTYAMGDLGLALGYTLGRDKVEGDTIGFAATYAIDDLSLGLQYETHDESASGAKDGSDLIGVYAGYAMGATSLNFAYMALTSDDLDNTDPMIGKGDASGFTVNAIQNLGDNMYVYVEYTATATEADTATELDTEFESFALGATYIF